MVFGMEATNELGSASLYVGLDAAVNLPAPLYGAAAGALAGTACRPRHALISVEGGDVRYRVDGTEVVEPFGIRANEGQLIDWTDPLRDFSSFLDRMSVIAARLNDGETNVLLNISWRS